MCYLVRHHQAGAAEDASAPIPPSVARVRPRWAGAAVAALIGGLAVAAIVAPSSTSAPPARQGIRSASTDHIECGGSADGSRGRDGIAAARRWCAQHTPRWRRPAWASATTASEVASGPCIHVGCGWERPDPGLNGSPAQPFHPVPRPAEPAGTGLACGRVRTQRAEAAPLAAAARPFVCRLSVRFVTACFRSAERHAGGRQDALTSLGAVAGFFVERVGCRFLSRRYLGTCCATPGAWLLHPLRRSNHLGGRFRGGRCGLGERGGWSVRRFDGSAGFDSGRFVHDRNQFHDLTRGRWSGRPTWQSRTPEAQASGMRSGQRRYP